MPCITQLANTCPISDNYRNTINETISLLILESIHWPYPLMHLPNHYNRVVYQLLLHFLCWPILH